MDISYTCLNNKILKIILKFFYPILKIYSLLRDFIVKVQRLNIKGLASFGKNSKSKGNKKEKEKGSNNI